MNRRDEPLMKRLDRKLKDALSRVHMSTGRGLCIIFILSLTIIYMVVYPMECPDALNTPESRTTSPEPRVPNHESRTTSPLDALKKEFDLEWPAQDTSPENVYDALIHPLHSEWSKMINEKHIGGGEGFSGQLEQQTVKYIEQIQKMVQYKKFEELTENVRVCEIGYNMGHSALTYLFGAEGLDDAVKVEYVGFSWPHNNHQLIAQEMKDTFGLAQRLSILWGDSTKTLPYYIGVLEQNQGLHRCDIVIVDGGHSLEVATKDIENMKHLANREHHVLIVDDLACNAGWCKGPVAAWTSLRDNGTFTEDGCWGDGKGDAEMTADRAGHRGFCWGTYKF